MRVVLNALQAGNRSGTGRYAHALAETLPDAAPNLELTLLWPAGLPAPADPRVNVLVRNARAARRLFADQWELRGICARLAPAVAHYPANIGPLLPMPRAALTIHDLSFLHHPEWFRGDRALYYRWAVSRSARNAAAILADSRFTAEDIAERLDVPVKRLHVVPLGVDPEFRPASVDACAGVRARHGLPEDFLLYVGTHEPRKNLPRVIAAWSALPGDARPDLVLAGRIGWKTGAIREAVRRAGAHGRIHFPGFIAQEDLPALLSAATAFVWPSLFEGFGLPPLEAMACGAPVLASNAASLPEVLGGAALLVEPHDTDAIRAGMERIVRDVELRARLVAAGFERAKQFTWRRAAERVAAMYAELLSD